MKSYVVFEPSTSRGVYDSWDVCESLVKGVKGAAFKSFPSRSAGEAALHDYLMETINIANDIRRRTWSTRV